jgi:TonB family protein
VRILAFDGVVSIGKNCRPPSPPDWRSRVPRFVFRAYGGEIGANDPRRDAVFPNNFNAFKPLENGSRADRSHGRMVQSLPWRLARLIIVMKMACTTWTVVGLLMASISHTAGAQATNAVDKKCSPPQATYSPAVPPSHYPSTTSALAIMYVEIDDKGKVQDVKVARSSGSSDFDHDALSTVRRWRFKPAMCDGKPIAVNINVEMNSRVIK